MRLIGKTALVTGATRGQGAAIARLFATEGAQVVLGARDKESGMIIVNEIRNSGGKAELAVLDVTNSDNWESALLVAKNAFGRLDVLVNNAGQWHGGLVEETTKETWDSMLNINATSIFIGTKLAIPLLKKAGGGSIINLSGTTGLVASGNATAYGAAKGAVRLFTKATAVQYGIFGIRANSIHPGPINTDMGSQVWPDDNARKAVIKKTLIGRLGTPEDIALGAVYLASDESSFVTGSELIIDGGATAH